MDLQNLTSKPLSTRKYIWLGVLFIIGMGCFFILLLKSQVKENEQINVVPSVTQNTTEPKPTLKLSSSYMYIRASDEATRFPLAKGVILRISGDSDKANIVGFDTLVTYDKMAFDFVSAKSLLSDFNLFSFDKKDYVSMTATKIIEKNKSTISVTPPFTNVPLIELVLMPKKAGNYTLGIGQVIGKESSKYVNDKTEIIYPHVNNISLEIY